MVSIKIKRLSLILLMTFLAGLMHVRAQEPTLPAPTLVPPTLVPTQPADVPQLAQFSGIATIHNEGVFRVGARYNAPPFSYLDENGLLNGYEVEIMNAIAAELGITIEWRQVTRENEIEDLLTGRVDALIGEQVHTRPAEQLLEFSHPYYLNAQRMVVIETQPYQVFTDLGGQPISVVQGSKADEAVGLLVEAGLGYDVRRYFTESQALDALANGEVQAMVGELDNLERAGRQGMRFIEQPVRLDPYAIAIRRGDVNLRNALNRSIQRMFASGQVTGIYGKWFPERDLDFDVLLPVYESIFEDPRSINEFNPDIPAMNGSVVDRIRNGETINVAGLSLTPDAATYERLLDPFNQAIMDELARRWSISINYVPGTASNSVDFIVSGQADIAVGVTPRWDGADRFDYSRPYAVHGDRLMVLEGSRFGGFGDFRGGSVMGYWYEDPRDADRITEIADALRVNTQPYEFRSHEEIVDQFGNRNVDGLFGDSLRLRAIIEVTRTSGLPWQIIEDEQYSRVPIAIAVPRNDADMRSLVDWTLQDMFLDGTYQQIYNNTFGEGEPLVMLTWAGDGSWLLGN
jgi:ABC-type amino acid transport substrate-binding protein